MGALLRCVVIGTPIAAMLTMVACAAGPAASQPVLSDRGEPAITRGLAEHVFACGSQPSCSGPASRFVEAMCGTVADDSGRLWTVPASVNAAGATCVDLYNDCAGPGDNPDYTTELSTLVIDDGGDDITGWLFGDNFFELYVNGTYVCRDSIGFTPFNSSAVRFTAEYPLTVAVRLVDWGTHLGVGLEYDNYRVGDGGFIARFSDGTITNADWSCQVFYVAPVDDATCVGDGRDTSGCPVEPDCLANPDACAALHYDVPADWMQPDFDAASWQSASTYPAEAVSGTTAYVQYASLFGDAEFIWTKNLNLDNQVLCRVTVDGPARPGGDQSLR